MKRGFFIGTVPERMDDLWMEITAQPSQPHFALDPGFPPHGHYVEPHDKHRVSRPPRQPHIFPPGHVLSVACPVCGVAASKQCREINPEGYDKEFPFRQRYFNQPRMAHNERYRLAWRVRLVSPPVRVTAMAASQADRILDELSRRWKLKEELDRLWEEIRNGEADLAAVKARIKVYEEKFK